MPGIRGWEGLFSSSPSSGKRKSKSVSNRSQYRYERREPCHRRLATYLAEQTGITVSLETVRLCLHRQGYVCKRPTWTLKCQAKGAGGLGGKRLRVEALLAGATMPELPPLEALIPPEWVDRMPADLPERWALLPQADLYLQDEFQVAWPPTLTRLWSRKKAVGGSARSKPRAGLDPILWT